MVKDIHIGKEISICSKRIHRKISKEAAKYGLTDVQSRVIGFIYNNSKERDIFQRDIETELDIRRSSVTSVLQLMEKKEYIKRVSVSEDARLKKLVLTEKGEEVQKQVNDFILNFEKSLREELTKEEMKTLIKLIDKLSKKIAE